MLWEDYSSVPSENVAPPPVGAPEDTTKMKNTNEIDRRMMAAISEIGDWVQGRFDLLGTMSNQNASAIVVTGGTMSGVAISGGTMASAVLDSTNSIDGAAIKSGIVPAEHLPPVSSDASSFAGWTPQQWYDMIFPVGTVHMKTQKSGMPALPTGVAATWVFQNVTVFPKALAAASYTGTPSSPQVGGSTSVTTSSAGGHNHGGTSGNTALTTAHLPPHAHTVSGGGTSGPIHSTGYAVGATIQSDADQTTSSVGSGTAHNHTIPAEPAHTHSVAMDPPWIGVQMWIRTA